jgi:pimeloyl-ACP methyl ester carboxylesterase
MTHDEVQCLSPAGFHSMRYTAWGDADNPRVVVCVHGLTRQGRDFDHLAQALQADFRVICPDVVGRGQSDHLRDWRHYQYPQYVQDMVPLIAKLKAGELYWVGTSMGGIIGMALAAMPGSPIQRLVLNDVGTRIPAAAMQRIDAYLGKDPDFASVDEYLVHMQAISPFGPMTDAAWLHFATHQVRQRSDGRWVSRYDPRIGDAFRATVQGTAIADVDLSPYWNAVRCPVLIIRGEHSDLLPPEVVSSMQARPGTQSHVALDCGHAPSLTRAEEISAIRTFLR